MTIVASEIPGVMHPETEICLHWDDPAIGVAWPVPVETAPELSKNDHEALPLSAIPAARLPAIED